MAGVEPAWSFTSWPIRSRWLYTGNKNYLYSIILDKFFLSCAFILVYFSWSCQVLSSESCTTFFHPSCQNRSHSFQHSVKNMLHNPEDIVPQEGVEPSRLAAAAFEVAVSTIPPPGQLLALFLYGVVMRPLYGARTRVTSLKGRRP